MWPQGRWTIRAKIVVAIVASMVALAMAAGVLVHAAGERNVRIAAEQAIDAAGQALAAAERADVEKLDATLRALSVHPGLAEAFAARDRARLAALAQPVFAALRSDDITHFYFIEPEPKRTCFLRVHRPAWSGDVVNRVTLARAIETRNVAAGKELGLTAFAIRVVRPWLAKDGNVLGYLELGEEIDQHLHRMKAQTGDDYAMVVEKRFLDEGAWASMRLGQRNDWNDRPRTVVVNSTTGDGTIAELGRDLASVPERGLLLDARARDGRVLVRGLVPVKDAGGRRVGGLFVLHDITALHESMLSARRNLYTALAIVAAVLAALLLALVNRLVLRRLERIMVAMEDVSARLADGNYDVVVPRPGAQDEIGRFERLFERFVATVAGLLKELTRKAR
jgi:HAMP domain-containing protein